ncbi:hypothetical protein OUZ56_006028 [Daphnia magna]|uniref:Uncharacterized protein n=1 Tax=Daphnia magna TaxID=35525 RepID=A0ABQ9YUF0_9CRUS|nr:hypothetical protein OUZ56_006028 [Daphnia magna]
MAVECHKALANIRSELVVIGVPFTTDPHHRLLRRYSLSSHYGAFVILEHIAKRCRDHRCVTATSVYIRRPLK